MNELRVIYLLTQPTPAAQQTQIPPSNKSFHNAEFVIWQLLKSLSLRCTSGPYLHS